MQSADMVLKLHLVTHQASGSTASLSAPDDDPSSSSDDDEENGTYTWVEAVTCIKTAMAGGVPPFGKVSTVQPTPLAIG